MLREVGDGGKGYWLGGKGLGHYFHILNVFFRDYVRRAYR